MFLQNIQSGYIKEFRSHAPVRTWCIGNQSADDGYWTLDLCKEEAAKYQTRDDWEKGSSVSYQKAINRGWLTKCTAHIKDFRRKPAVPAVWTIEKCAEIAKQCQKRSEFKKRFHYPYEKARLNGWLDICCAHME